MTLRDQITELLVGRYGTTNRAEDAVLILHDGRLLAQSEGTVEAPRAHVWIAAMVATVLDKPILRMLDEFLRAGGLVRLTHYGGAYQKITAFDVSCGGLTKANVNRILSVFRRQWRNWRKIGETRNLYLDLNFEDDMDTFEAENPTEALSLTDFLEEKCGPEWWA